MEIRPRGPTKDSVLAERKRGAKSAAEIAKRLGLLPSYVRATLTRNGVPFPVRRSEKQRARDMHKLLRRAYDTMSLIHLSQTANGALNDLLADIKAELDNG